MFYTICKNYRYHLPKYFRMTDILLPGMQWDNVCPSIWGYLQIEI